MEKFKEIHNYLNNTIELGSKILKKDISTILSKYLNNGAIYDYSIVCDNTNNPPHIVVNKLINIDVYFAIRFKCLWAVFISGFNKILPPSRNISPFGQKRHVRKYKPFRECPNCFIHQQCVVCNQGHQISLQF